MTMYYRLKGEEDFSEVTKEEMFEMIRDENLVTFLNEWLGWNFVDIAFWLNEHLGMATDDAYKAIIDEIMNSNDIDSVQDIYGEDYEVINQR